MEQCVPYGFRLYPTPPGFTQHCGPVYLHDERPQFATRIQAHHLNSVRIVHGGFLATLADSAFGVVIKRDLGLQAPPVTINLSLDYIGAVREGDWLVAEVQLHKVGSKITNGSCLLSVDERLVLRASGIFMMATKLSPG